MQRRLLFFFLFLATAVPALSQEQENLKIVWPEEYNWKIGSNQETEQVHVMELIPGKETLENWTLMGNMMSIKGGQNIPVDVAMNMMFQEAQKNSDNAVLTQIEKSTVDATTPWVLFKIEAKSFKDDKNPESQLYYITRGKTALYSNFIAIREARLKDKFVEKWAKVFKSSEVVWQ